MEIDIMGVNALKNVTYEIDAGTAWITINRPDKLNALNRETVQEIISAVRQARKDDEVLANVLTGEGDKVFVAVNGFALGGGCELAMACHVRLAADSARFGQPEVNLELIPGAGGTQRLQRLVGRGRALDLILSGKMIEAAKAEQIGLARAIETVVSGGEISQAEAMREGTGAFLEKRKAEFKGR